MRRLATECFGTLALVFAGTGAIRVSHVGIALTFGLVVLAMIPGHDLRPGRRFRRSPQPQGVLLMTEAARQRPRRVLFVCVENANRSQMAELQLAS